MKGLLQSYGSERFYQKVGFVRTGPEKDLHGLPAIPMEAKMRQNPIPSKRARRK